MMLESEKRFGIMDSFARNMLLLTLLALVCTRCSFAETRSAQDMAKECRVAVDLSQGRVEKNFESPPPLPRRSWKSTRPDLRSAVPFKVVWKEICPEIEAALIAEDGEAIIPDHKLVRSQQCNERSRTGMILKK
jgi:hypothetical protein